MSFLSEFGVIFRKNIRDYGMYIALFVIIVIFSIVTEGSFISPVNISNLINQTGYVAVLAVGMTLIIIIRHIDLSVGFLSGFLGAVAAIFMTQMGMQAWLAILIVLVLGGIIGWGYGLLVAKVSVPAFVVTLGGMMFFHGMEIKVTEATGTITIPNAGFISIGNGFIPSLGMIGGFSISTLVIGVIGILLFVYFQNKERNTKLKYNFEVLSKPFFFLKVLLITIIIIAICLILAANNGISWTLVVMGIVVFAYNFLMNKTALGRHVYGVGGNPEAAELSGISVAKITVLVFTSMGALTALSGIL
jgi:putative multiple sugar transport system permease protein